MKAPAFFLSALMIWPTFVTAEDSAKPSTPDGEPLVELRHAESVYAATFNADGSRVATASKDGAARLWDARTGKLLRTLTGMKHGKDKSRGKLLTVSFNADGSRLAGISTDEHTYLWDPNTGEQVSSLCGRKWRHTVAAFRRDGRHLLTVEYGRAIIYDADSGKRAHFLQGSEDEEEEQEWLEANYVESAAYSPDGRLLLTVTDSSAAILWDANTFERLRELATKDANLDRGLFSPDSRRIATLGGDGRARIWDIETGRELASLPAQGRFLLYSPDGDSLATVSGRVVQIWDPNGGVLRAELKGNEDVILSAVFSPDGKRFASGSKDNTARVWSLSDGKLLSTLQHTKNVHSVRFSPDSRRVLTASKDGTAKIWQIASRSDPR